MNTQSAEARPDNVGPKKSASVSRLVERLCDEMADLPEHVRAGSHVITNAEHVLFVGPLAAGRRFYVAYHLDDTGRPARILLDQDHDREPEDITETVLGGLDSPKVSEIWRRLRDRVAESVREPSSESPEQPAGTSDTLPERSIGDVAEDHEKQTQLKQERKEG